MTLKSRLLQIKKRFIEIWSENKIFRYAIFIHLGYFIITLFVVLIYLYEQNDFRIFFEAGGVVLEDINNLYNQEYYIWDFRYLPLSAIMFIPFYFMGFTLGFIIFHIINLILNILICIILYKIIILVRGEGHEQDDKRVILYISIYLMSIPHVLNYILGQINLFITFFILSTLYILLKHEELKWQLIGGLLIGISIVIKPTALFIIPFLLVIHFDMNNKKLTIDFSKSFIRLIGIMIPISLNIILFIIYPLLLEGFLATNFTGSNPLTINFSFSITKNILNFCYIFNIPFNQLYVLITIIAIVGGLGFIIYIIGRFDEQTIIYGFTFSIMIMLLVYYDSWNHHLLNLTPLLIIIIFNLPRQSEHILPIKRAFFFFTFLDLAFMGLWFLTLIYFPFNFASTIFLIITYTEISRYNLSKSKIDNNKILKR